MNAFGDQAAWFVTGSQGLYGDDALAQVADHARQIGQGLDGSPDVPVRVVTKPVVTSPEGIAQLLADADADPSCLGVVAWMHTFSPAKMWIAGLLALRKPLVHLHTQANRDLPWGEIDMDFMNLNQSAHGDREFGFVLTRLRIARTTIVGHWQDPLVTQRLGQWARAAAGAAEARRLKVCRFGDNMRQVAVTEGDKTEVQVRLGVSVDGYGVNDLVAAVQAAADADVDAVVADCLERYDVVPELRPGGARHASLRDAARIEVGLRARLEVGGYRAFTDTFEDLGDLAQLPGLAVQRLMADGYGFGGEGDWKTATLVRLLKVMATGLPGGTSFMEDYTYHLGEPRQKILGAHMLEVCPSITAERPTCEIHPWASGASRTRSAWCSRHAPAPGSSSGCRTWAIACDWSPTRSTWWSRTLPCHACRWRARYGSRVPTCAPRRPRGSWPVARITPRSRSACPPRSSGTSRAWSAWSSCSSTATPASGTWRIGSRAEPHQPPGGGRAGRQSSRCPPVISCWSSWTTVLYSCAMSMQAPTPGSVPVQSRMSRVPWTHCASTEARP